MPFGKRRAYASWLALACLSLSGCVDGQGDDLARHALIQRLTPKPESATSRIEAIELPGILSHKRSLFQTRSTVELTLRPPGLDGGVIYSLINDTTGAVLGENEALPALEALGLDSGAGATYEVVIRLFPSSPAMRGKLAYADNVLRLVLQDEEQPAFATSTLTMRDFAAFAVGWTAFASGEQRADGLQGDVSAPTHPYATNGTQTVLTSGMIPLLNQ